MEQDSLTLLIQLAGLVQSQHSQSIRRAEAAPELMVSLVLPFVQFITDSQEVIQREISTSVEFQQSIAQLKDMIVSIFEKNILHDTCLAGQEDKVIQDIFRLYLSLQAGLLKSSNERLKSLFIDQANNKKFTGAQLAMVLEVTSQKILQTRVSNEIQALDILLETILQVHISQSREQLHSESLNVIAYLVESFCSK